MGVTALAAGVIAAAQGGQQHLLALQGCIGVIAALHVGAEEAGEIDALTAGAETGVLHIDLGADHGQAGIGHLAGHGAFPDQFVEG